MKIENLKDLKRLLELCQTQGVKTITVDGISLELNERITAPKRLKQIKEPGSFASNTIDEQIQIPQMDIPTDELSEEDLLFYSAPAQEA